MDNRNIVVIGGSAGAVTPLKEVLGALPEHLPASVFVVLHIPANSTGIFTALASAVSRLRVSTAVGGAEIEPGHIYIAPPNRHLLVIDNHIELGAGPRENLTRPAIDPLFRSAAFSHGPRTVGLIMSGMLNDGASGLAAVKKCGGIALVQAPQDAVASEMPLAALEATPVDLSAPAAEIAPAIIRFVSQKPGKAMPPSLELKLEVEIAAGGRIDTPTLEKLAQPVPLTCPDCGGVLSYVHNERPLRFRCQVGHAFTGKALLHDQESSVDEAIRVALRIIEERAELVERMSRDAAQVGRTSVSDMYKERATEYRSYAGTLREAIVNTMETKAKFDTGSLVEQEVKGDLVDEDNTRLGRLAANQDNKK
jgi:two-component system chemotaxis response regulator CheB